MVQARNQRFRPVILATWEIKNRRIKVQGQSRQTDPIFKITRTKWTWRHGLKQ
jgi:hypothetical protein